MESKFYVYIYVEKWKKINLKNIQILKNPLL